jgi:hypothetical protein
MRVCCRNRYLIYCCGVLLLQGCAGAGSDPNREKTVPVKGKVTYKGDPVADASVTLIPDTPPGQTATRKGAFGRTNNAGEFTLTTFEPDDGAIPGNYKVTVRKYEAQKSTAALQESDDYVPPEESGEDSGPPKSLLPAQYGDNMKTPLTANIVDGDNSPLNLELTD